MKKLVFTSFLLLLSCNAEAPDSIGEINADGEFEETKKNDSAHKEFTFPQTLDETSNCVEPTPAPALCEWGEAAFDIVLLEVTGTSMIVSPSIDGKTGELVENCEGIIEAGFRIEGVVQQSIKGLSGKINVDVGVNQYADHWDPQPWVEPNPDGSVKNWVQRVGIQSGDVIGITLHKNPTTGTLGILGEHFFDIDPAGSIRFGELHSECGSPKPKNASGLTFKQLKEEVTQCEPNLKAADVRKQAKEKMWENPIFANLGTCWQ